MPILECNGIPINYRQVGEGKNLILIHGLAANHAFWSLHVLLPLSRQFRVTVFDLRGHGYSGMPANGYSSSIIAEDILQLMDQLDIKQADFVGHSFGGLVALHFAALHQDRINRLVVCDSRIHAIQVTNYRRDWPNSEKAIARLHELGLDIPEDEPDSGIWLLEQLAQPQWRKERKKLKGSPLFLSFGGWGGGDKSAERWLELLRTTSARKDLTGFNGPSLEQLKEITRPVLLYYGEHSALLKSMQGLESHLPNNKIRFAKGGGHFFPLSQPKKFACEVECFMDADNQSPTALNQPTSLN